MRIVVIGGGAAGVCAAGLLSRPDLLSALLHEADSQEITAGVKRQMPISPKTKTDALSNTTSIGNNSPTEILVLEKGDALLRKLRATGNGRCNFTNAHVSTQHYTGESAERTAPVLARFGFRQAVRFFSLLGIPYTTLESGMTYPMTLRADTVADRLMEWITSAGVSVRTDCSVEKLNRQDTCFALTLSTGERITADIVLLATGGSYGIGKKEWSNGYTLAKEAGHRLTRLHPGIVPLAVRETVRTAALSGVKVKAQISAQEQCITDDVLFTAYGLSGTGILRISNRVLDALNDMRQTSPSRKEKEKENKAVSLTVNLLPERKEEEWLGYLSALAERFPNIALKTLFRGILPAQIVDELLIECRLSGESISTVEEAARLLHRACHWDFSVIGAHKNDHGQVTCGGVDTGQWNNQTMESTLCPGLYLVGEVLDIQGECGGYNLHWAWASALAAAEAIEKTAREKVGCV